MHFFLSRRGWLGAAATLGIAVLWLVLRADDGAPLPTGAPLASAHRPEPAPRKAAPNPNAAETRWQPKAASPSASASAVDMGPVYGRNGRTLDFGGLTAAQYIDKHAVAARRGDAHAAYQVYQAESVCAVGNDAVPEFNLPEQRLQFMRERDALAALCAQVSPAQVQERLTFLSQAARSGLLDAQIDFYIEGPYGRAQENISSDDPILKNWREESLMHLNNALNQCDPYAMGLLANAWDAGDFGGRDASLAAAYAVAEARTRHSPLSVAQLTGRFGDELSPEQIEASMRTGQNMARDACKNP